MAGFALLLQSWGKKGKLLAHLRIPFCQYTGNVSFYGNIPLCLKTLISMAASMFRENYPLEVASDHRVSVKHTYWHVLQQITLINVWFYSAKSFFLCKKRKENVGLAKKFFCFFFSVDVTEKTERIFGQPNTKQYNVRASFIYYLIGGKFLYDVMWLYAKHRCKLVIIMYIYTYIMYIYISNPHLYVSTIGRRVLWAPDVALVAKNLPINAGNISDAGSTPGLGRSPGGGHGNPLQYSCLETPMDRGAWRATVHGIARVHGHTT